MESTDYPFRMKQIDIEIISEFNGAKRHHILRCMKCNHEWRATPISKLQNYKKYGTNGCPSCNNKRIRDNEKITAAKNIALLEQKGFILMEEYKGRLKKILIKKVSCGHSWKAQPGNLLARNVNCKICNDQRKRKAFQVFNNQRQEEYQKTATEWDIYIST